MSAAQELHLGWASLTALHLEDHLCWQAPFPILSDVPWASASLGRPPLPPASCPLLGAGVQPPPLFEVLIGGPPPKEPSGEPPAQQPWGPRSIQDSLPSWPQGHPRTPKVPDHFAGRPQGVKGPRPPTRAGEGTVQRMAAHAGPAAPPASRRPSERPFHPCVDNTTGRIKGRLWKAMFSPNQKSSGSEHTHSTRYLEITSPRSWYQIKAQTLTSAEETAWGPQMCLLAFSSAAKTGLGSASRFGSLAGAWEPRGDACSRDSWVWRQKIFG